MQPKIDPTLVDLLQKTRASAEPIQVVVVLKPAASSELPSSSETREAAHDLIQRVEKETGEAPRRYNVFGNLSSFAIEATPNFIRRLVEMDEVLSAISNRQPGSKREPGNEVPDSSKVVKRPISPSSRVPAIKRSKTAPKKK